MGDDFWGFWMLGGMSGGGMGFLFAPHSKAHAQERLQAIMTDTKRQMEHAVPFAMEPVVYDFAINEQGTEATLLAGDGALMPAGYYALTVPPLLRMEARLLSPARRTELERFTAACQTVPEFQGMVQHVFEHLIPQGAQKAELTESLEALLEAHGFDRVEHEQIQADLRGGRLGLGQNRLPITSRIVDAGAEDLLDATEVIAPQYVDIGNDALAAGMVAVVSFAGGAGSRWTKGAGTVKALNPFCRLGGKHRSFIEVHLAHSRRTGRLAGTEIPHVITTSYLTHDAIEEHLRRERNYDYPGSLLLSPGRSIGLRFVPMETGPAICLGGNAAADARRTGAKGSRQPARDADRLGSADGRGIELYRQCAHAMPAPRGPLVRSAQHAPQRHAAATVPGMPAAEIPDGSQYRYHGSKRRPGAARVPHFPRRGADHGGHRATGGRPWRRPGTSRRPRCAWSKVSRSPARRLNPPSPGTTAQPIGSTSTNSLPCSA